MRGKVRPSFFPSDQISKRHVRGKAYASLFLTTLPHTSLDAGTWVWSWVIGTFSTAGSHLNYFGLKAIIGLYSFFLAVQLLAQLSFFILGAKVRSRALLFIYRLFFQLVYHVFYRNLVRPPPPSLSKLLESIDTSPRSIYPVRPPALPHPVRHSPTSLLHLHHPHLPYPNVPPLASPSADCNRLPESVGGACRECGDGVLL